MLCLHMTGEHFLCSVIFRSHNANEVFMWDIYSTEERLTGRKCRSFIACLFWLQTAGKGGKGGATTEMGPWTFCSLLSTRLRCSVSEENKERGGEQWVFQSIKNINISTNCATELWKGHGAEVPSLLQWTLMMILNEDEGEKHLLDSQSLEQQCLYTQHYRITQNDRITGTGKDPWDHLVQLYAKAGSLQ